MNGASGFSNVIVSILFAVNYSALNLSTTLPTIAEQNLFYFLKYFFFVDTVIFQLTTMTLCMPVTSQEGLKTEFVWFRSQTLTDGLLLAVEVMSSRSCIFEIGLETKHFFDIAIE